MIICTHPERRHGHQKPPWACSIKVMLTWHLRKKKNWHYSCILCLSCVLFTNLINKSPSNRYILKVLIERVLFIEISIGANGVTWLQIMNSGFLGGKHCVRVASEPRALSADGTTAQWCSTLTAPAERATDKHSLCGSPGRVRSPGIMGWGEGEGT